MGHIVTVSGIKKVFSHFHRRRRPVESHVWWDHLNYAQKFAVSSLYHYGYEICFVRKEKHGSLVIMSLDDKLATVDQDGLIDTNPDVKCRR